MLLAAVIVALGACGGDDDDSGLGPFPVGGDQGGTIPGSTNVPPTAVITVSQLVGTELSVTFNGSASTDRDGTISSFFWAFGDGQSANTPLVSHRYAVPGDYLVTLTVTDNDGASDTASITISVGQNPNVNLAPGAAFTVTPTSGFAPLSVAFDATLSQDSDGLIVDFQWRFGDGTSGTGPLVNHTYTAPGVYLVQLAVTDNRNARGVATQSITVLNRTGQTGTGTGGTGGIDGGGVIVLSAQELVGAVGADMRTVHPLSLGAGEAVQLLFPVDRIAVTDLDLFLFDVSEPERPVLAGSSVGLGNSELVTAPAAGAYVLLVEAVGVGTDYRLLVGSPAGESTMPVLTDHFTAGVLLRHASGVAAEQTAPLREPVAIGPADSYWAGQPLAAHYQTLRRAKQLGLDPAVEAVELERPAATGR